MNDTAADIAHGFINLVTGKNSSIADVRLAICDGCSCYKGGVCSMCKCLMKLKATLPKKHCPLGKW